MNTRKHWEWVPASHSQRPRDGFCSKHRSCHRYAGNVHRMSSFPCGVLCSPRLIWNGDTGQINTAAKGFLLVGLTVREPLLVAFQFLL